MVKFRDVVLRDAYPTTDSMTVITDLDMTDAISAIHIGFVATNGTTSNKANRIDDIVTNIEVVDGSDVLASLSMKELLALHFFHTRGKVPILRPGEWASGSQEEGATLFFGRYLYDKEFYLDPTKFKNPQIKVTVNLAAVRAVSATTAFATGTGRLTLIAKVMEGASGARGFLMNKNAYSWTTAASGDETIDLPRDYQYKAMMIKSLEVGSDVDEGITKIKISADNDKYIPINQDVNDLWEQNIEQFGEFTYRHDFQTQTVTAITVIPNHDPVGAFKSTTEGRIFWEVYEFSSAIYLNIETDAGVAVATDEQVRGHITGSAPFGTVFIDFGSHMDPNDWLAVSGYKSVKAVATQGNAGGAASIVLQQLRTY